ncbi:hypothetical protein BN938_0881 [Mucinivorans hirudinis]|uniref:Polymerase/histidinol phosphatase N-terminal domain-containing protein n=1 Tax=Mucinivorans hirudinis TaxID=1433126 RepID=A0A060R709_9BACT|nr:hypothetical protein BN938_0881 [Mucinivorans hirudinis]
MKKKVLITAFAALLLQAGAQHKNSEKMGDYQPKVRREISIPDIDGMKVIKCDFHMHTVNSDGNIAPWVRVDEAWEEGLDAIAITDHISHTAGSRDENRSYNQALAEAQKLGITLIRGGEMSYSMAPGHANALFIEDVNKLQTGDWRAAFAEAKAQGAFIEWNHPGWGVDTIKWHKEHTELFEKGMLNGIEIFCELEWYPEAVEWCFQKNLTLIANTDSHESMARLYDFNTMKHRPMTLVLASDNSADAIKEALFAGRTIAYFYSTLIGKEALLRSLFNSSIEISKPHLTKDNQKFVRVSNSSDIDFELSIKNSQKGCPEKITIPGGSSINVVIGSNADGVSYFVDNCLISHNKKLEVVLF